MWRQECIICWKLAPFVFAQARVLSVKNGLVGSYGFSSLAITRICRNPVWNVFFQTNCFAQGDNGSPGEYSTPIFEGVLPLRKISREMLHLRSGCKFIERTRLPLAVTWTVFTNVQLRTFCQPTKYASLTPGEQSPAISLAALREKALSGGGSERLQRQHAAGKLSARERLDVLLDAGSFQEMGLLVGEAGEGCVTGRGRVSGRDVYVYSQDFTLAGGSLGALHASKICKLMDRALRARSPVIGLSDSGGARIQEGIASLAGYTEVFKRSVLMSGVVPQISVIMGPSAGGAVYAPALTDFVFMVRSTSHMFLTGPDVVQSVTKETVTRTELGGADVHSTKSGVCQVVGDNDIETLRKVRELLSYLPDTWDAPHGSAGRQIRGQGNGISRKQGEGVEEFKHSAVSANHFIDPPERVDPALDRVVPIDPNLPYDMLHVVQRIVDHGELFQVHERWARNIITAFGRLDGITVGIVANQPKELAGVLDIDASCKAARHVRFCDAFNIPLVTFVDVPGFLPGSAQEHGGVIRHGAKLLFAYADATVPKLTVITRKAYGGAYCVMSSSHLRGDYNYIWPTAEVAVMGAAGAARVLHRKASPEELDQHAREYAAQFCNGVAASQRGDVDGVIAACDTRPTLCADLRALSRAHSHSGIVRNVPRKHGCIPL